MARILIKCKDEYNNEVWFETSEHDGKDLVKTYDMRLKWLEDNGFTPMQVGAKGFKPKPKEEKQIIDGKVCPKCGQNVWDNREKILGGQFSVKSPHFACSDKKCGWAVWPEQYELQ